MDSKTLTTLAVVGGFVLVAVMLLNTRKTTAGIAPAATTPRVTAGNSVWADIGQGLGGLFKGWTGGGSSSSEGGYTLNYTPNSIGTLGGEE